MKKLVLLFVATLFFANFSLAQESNKVKATGCSANCFFNDCMIRCPSGSIPRCNCIVGSFSSCSCSETVGRVTIKNEHHINTVLDFLNANKLTRFKSSFESIFQALRKDDLNQYSKAFGELEQLALTDPKNARKIEDFISSLR